MGKGEDIAPGDSLLGGGSHLGGKEERGEDPATHKLVIPRESSAPQVAHQQ